ncbi:MAG TPA: glycosyltransferase family 39 protein [Anaerolineae bacterium]|nr:glycosyltransferase family 39 protein [Anaerolineae bacterium]
MRDETRVPPYVSRFTLHASSGLAVILLAYFAIALQYAARTPAWQVPDEPAHYNYVRYVVENRAVPVLRTGDYDQLYNEQFTHPANTPRLSIDPLRYEYWQPPLYYLLAAPVYALTGGNLFALRLVSVAFGGALIVVAFLIVREIHPNRLAWALGTSAFVAFIPQHIAMLAGVNNDSLAELLLALTLLQTLRVSNPERVETLNSSRNRGLLTLGVLLGLGFLTKGTNYLLAPVVFVALIAYHVSRITYHVSRLSPLASRLLLVFLPALALGALWWLRNVSVYGGLDILGLANHNAVVVGQPLTSDWIARLGFGPFLIGALTTTFHSFWGQFGWMGVPMPDPFYLALGMLSFIAVLGWLWCFRTNQPTNHQTIHPTRLPAFLLSLLTFLTFAYYIFYNFTFVQHQGRYLYPALAPLGLVFSIGLERWTRLLPRPINALVFAAAFAALAALAIYALYRFVIPALAV